MNHSRHHHRQSPAHPGFSLLEIVLSLTIIIGVFTIVMSAVVGAVRDNRARQQELASTDKAQQIVRSTVSLIRQTQSNVTGAAPIISATSSGLTFYTSVNGAIVQQRIFLTGTTLQLGQILPVGNPPTYPAAQEKVTVLLTNLRNGSQPLFQYYDKSYTGTQAAMNPITPDAIRVVKMTVVVDDDPSKAPAPYTIELQAHLRNLKDNY